MLAVVIAADTAMQNIVAVGRDHQLVDGESHLFGEVTGKDISEVTGRHREGYRTVGRDHGKRGIKVTNDLSQEPRPVDRVNRYQRATVRQEGLITKTGLNHVLTIIKVTLKGDIVHVGFQNRRHLATLNVRDTIVRMKNKDIDVIATTAAFDCSRSGITGGRTHHHNFLITFFKQMIQQVTKKLQREVFECQRRALEQLQNPFVMTGLHQRSNRIVTDRAV